MSISTLVCLIPFLFKWNSSGISRSLLSSTHSGRNPAESGQFPEFWRNQIWQRGLPNWFNDSDGISNGIQILPEWFLESHGRNQFPEFNRTESGSPTTIRTMPSHAQIDRRCLPTINLGVVNNPKPYSLSQPPSSTTPTQLVTITSAHHHLTSSPVALNDHCTPQHSKNKTRMPLPLKNNATTPCHWLNEHPPGATSLTATWQPDDEWQRRLSSFTFS